MLGASTFCEQADFVALVIARDDYQTRKERDDANAISQE